MAHLLEAYPRRRRPIPVGQPLPMEIDERHLNTVAFLCIETRGAIVPQASAFFVAVPAGFEDWFVVYVVTARHCIEATAGREFVIRCNGPTGTVDSRTRADQWSISDDADVAVAIFEPEQHSVISHVPMSQFVRADYTLGLEHVEGRTYRLDVRTGEQLDHLPVGVGNELFFVSLFTPAPGRGRVLPIARFGHISRMPAEPIPIEAAGGGKNSINAYLAESRSWGGHSGAPVFWRHPIARIHEMADPDDPEKRIRVQFPEFEAIGLLGLVSGHFDIDRPADVRGDAPAEVIAKLNAGVAVVTPAHDIQELLMRDDVAESRAAWVAERRAETEAAGTATFDVATDGGNDEFERFEALTRKLVQTPKPERRDSN